MSPARATYVERVLTLNGPALLGFFLRRISNPSDAADLMSETAESAWKASRRLPADEAEARMWLFGVARNVLMHHHRTSRRREALTRRLAEAISRSPIVVGNDEVQELRAAVDALPDELGELIRLVHWDGFTLTEAAAFLGVPASTLRSRHARAKDLLKTALEPAFATEAGDQR